MKNKHTFEARLRYMKMLEEGHCIKEISRAFAKVRDTDGLVLHERIKIRLNGKSPVQYRALIKIT